MKHIQSLTEPGALLILREIVGWLRPEAPLSELAGPEVDGRIRELCGAFDENEGVRQRIAESLRGWLWEAGLFSSLTSVGILPRKGFHRELGRRLYEKINPPPRDINDLADMFALVFRQRHDGDWVVAVSGSSWIQLFMAIWIPPGGDLRSLMNRARDELLYALELLSIWVAAEELEPDLVRLDPRLKTRESPFVAFQREVAAFVRGCEVWRDTENETWPDDAHVRVLLEQCAGEIVFFRRRSVSHGTSIATTYLLERLEQTLQRITVILDIIDLTDLERSVHSSLELFRDLVEATTQRNSVRDLWRQNIRLLSRTVTENVSDHGEHYITRDRSEYFAMLRSAAGAGLIIPFMALLKIRAGSADFDPAVETLVYCLIYGLGFVFIHLLGFTIATKQPAMTAARFASAVEKEGRGGANPGPLARLLVQVGRSQFIAIVGNVAVALSLSMLVEAAFRHLSGQPLLDESQRQYQLTALSPFAGFALFHAAIAGVWLFLSGLIAGFFDNRAVYLSAAERFRYHPFAVRFLSSRVRENMGRYLADHSGAIAGNFLFGCMLGATGYAGRVFGLSLDIRHVAFSSANLGYSGVQDLGLFIRLFAFVLMIGMVNLAVSFSLALFVALRARGVRIRSLRLLLRALGREIRQHPLSLIWPPRV